MVFHLLFYCSKMACIGFTCSKNALTALNVLYLLVAVVLIVVGALAKGASIVSSMTVVGGIIAAGVFLLIVAVLGLIAAHKHHQVMLFFYMIILFLIFLVQFFVAVACLAMNENHVQDLVKTGWDSSSNQTRNDAVKHFECHEALDQLSANEDHPYLADCISKITRAANDAVQVAGGIGLFFSFTEILGIWLAMRYRNLKDPRANPNSFL